MGSLTSGLALAFEEALEGVFISLLVLGPAAALIFNSP
jgi:hypothetical protein